MPTTKAIQKWVAIFADASIKQTDAIWDGDAKLGNQHADRSLTAFEKLRAAGDEGREALLILLRHPRKDVRVSAAAFLLRYRTELATAILKKEAKGRGMVSFVAEQALKRWEEGDWSLDPED